MNITNENYTEYLIEESIEVKFGEITYFKTTYNLNTSTVLFIHGSGGNKKWFIPHFINHNIKDYNWLVPTLFGYDRVDKPKKLEAFTMEQFAEDLMELLNHEGVTDLVIIGHSMGGKVGILLTELLMKQSKINLIAFYNAEGPFLIEEFSDDDLSIAKGTHEDYISKFEKFQQTFLDKGDENAKRIWEHNNTLGSFLVWAVFHNFTKLVENRSLFDIVKTYRDKVHFAYICGEKSGHLPTKKLYQDEGLEVITIPEAGHIMMNENPIIFWEKSLGFNYRKFIKVSS